MNFLLDSIVKRSNIAFFFFISFFFFFRKDWISLGWICVKNLLWIVGQADMIILVENESINRCNWTHSKRDICFEFVKAMDVYRIIKFELKFHKMYTRESCFEICETYIYIRCYLLLDLSLIIWILYTLLGSAEWIIFTKK